VEDFIQISLRAFARIQARADGGVPLGDLLTDEGLSGEAWIAAKKGWLGLIGADVERGDFRLSQQYQRAYMKERPELVTAPEPAAAATEQAPLELAPPAPGEPRSAPGPAIPPPEPAHETPAPSPPAEPAAGADALALAGAAEPSTASVLMSTDVNMTLKGDVRANLGSLLPFKGEAEAPESVLGELEPVPEHQVGMTVKGDVNVADLGLPFGPKPAPKASPPPSAPPASSPAPPAHAVPPPAHAVPPRAPASHPATGGAAPAGSGKNPLLNQRVAVTKLPSFGDQTLPPAQPTPKVAALPFSGKAAPPKPVAEELEPESKQLRGMTLEGEVNIKDVAPALIFRPETPRSAPAGDAASSDVVELTENQYAAYRAEQRIWPDATEARDRRYGLTTQGAAAALESHWRARCDQDSALRDRLDQLIERWEAWYRKQG